MSKRTTRALQFGAFILLAFSFRVIIEIIYGSVTESLGFSEKHLTLRTLTLTPDPLLRLVFCVVSQNARTASAFHTNIFQRIGNGHFDYDVQTTASKCGSTTQQGPIINMILAKQVPFQLERRKRSKTNELFLVSGDEYCDCNVKYCSDPEAVFARQYYSSKYGNESFYLPLGPRLEFPVSNSKGLVSSQRRFLFNLIVSPTSLLRQRLFGQLQQQVARTMHYPEVFLHMTPGFRANASVPHPGFLNPAQYNSVLQNSSFTLCPIGHNPESFRIFEAIEAGSIPVLVRQEVRHSCVDSFYPLIESGAPFPILDDWNQLNDKLLPFVLDSEQLDDLQNAVRLWYQEYFTKITSAFECKLLKHWQVDSNKLLSWYDLPTCE